MSEEKLLAERVIDEVEKAVVGKREILTQIMTAILAGGHILIDDIPGTGKTTMALAISTAKAQYTNLFQLTPDALPADQTEFTIYQKKTDEFTYQPGAVMCNLLLADEINRTSPKTQSALLEVMEEHQVTVDGVTRRTGDPFIVIATENPVGSAGTQLLPDSQLDRFMICVSMGYPTVEDEMEILRRSQELTSRQDTTVQPVLNAETLLSMQASVREIFVHDLIFRYMAELAKATRENEWIELGLSPRGSVALTAMSKACAFLKGRKYVIPADVAEVFPCVASHRIFLNIKAKVGHIQVSELLRQILETVPQPALKKRR